MHRRLIVLRVVIGGVADDERRLPNRPVANDRALDTLGVGDDVGVVALNLKISKTTQRRETVCCWPWGHVRNRVKKLKWEISSSSSSYQNIYIEKRDRIRLCVIIRRYDWLSVILSLLLHFTPLHLTSHAFIIDAYFYDENEAFFYIELIFTRC